MPNDAYSAEISRLCQRNRRRRTTRIFQDVSPHNEKIQKFTLTRNLTLIFRAVILMQMTMFIYEIKQ